MNKANNYQTELDSFRKNFSAYQEKNIVLYGIGRYTATLLSGISGYHFVGLMDRDSANIGKTMFGLPVVSKETAEQRADLVVINTAEEYWKIIYDRIKGMRIPIYFRNGQLAGTTVCEDDFSSNRYWKKNGADLRKKIQKYDIISFDIFDTLVMRKVFILDDIFKIAALRIQKKWKITDFYQERLLAGEGSNEANWSLDDIYSRMNARLQLSEEMLEQIKEIEVMTEMEQIVPRREMVEILNEISVDQTVWLVSDMYLSSSDIRRILKKCGVKHTEHIWISSERKKNKKSGELWEEYKQKVVKGQRALHIGNDLVSDGKMPRKYGIDTYYVMSASAMLRESSAGHLASCIGSLEESVFAGLLCVRIFNSPFALSCSRGLVTIKEFETLGYCVFGVVIFTFLTWLVKEAENRGIERLIFFARDGYLLQKNYHFLSELFRQEEFPKDSYLAISRRIGMITSFQCEDDLKEMISHPYNGSFSEYIADRFALCTDADDVHAQSRVNLPQDYEKVVEWLEPYDARIMEKVKKEKEDYLLYLQRQNLNEKDGMVDLWFQGNNQYYLSKTIGKSLTGFYFAVNKDQSNRCGRNNQLIPCFQREDDVLAETCNVLKSQLWIESFLTAPYGMIQAVDRDGKYICDQEGMNQKYWECRTRIYDGICEMEKEYIDSFDGDMRRLKPVFAECFWEEVVAGRIVLSDSLKKVFFHDNRIVKRWEECIFE